MRPGANRRGRGSTHRARETVAWTLMIAGLAVSTWCLWNARRPVLRILIHQGVEGVPLKRVIQDFCDEKRVNAEIIERSYDALYEEELDAAKGKRAYDVIELDDPWFPALCSAGRNPEQPGCSGLSEVKLTPPERKDIQD